MHSYLHNIKTFNNATRHLTRVERSVYRDLIELYYDTEQPLNAVQFDRLCKRIMANSDEEIAALEYILDEFFERTGDVYTHDFCDHEIEKFQNITSAKSAAGRASAEARKQKADKRKQSRKGVGEQNLTPVEQPLKYVEQTMNHEPLTINNKETNPERVIEVFEYWQSVMNTDKSKLTDSRRSKIKTRLKNYSVEDLKKAIDGCARSSFHMGSNDNGALHNDLTLIFRSDEKIEYFQNIGASQNQEKEFRGNGI
jgi:uncharacterized protein YdaU (DUF1376 family)